MTNKLRVGYIPVTSEIISQIKFHQKRTGVGPQKLLRAKRDSLPNGLSSSVIYNWINGKSTTAKEEFLQYVIRQYKALPNASREKKSNKSYKEDLSTIPEKDWQRLKKIHELTGILPSKLFQICDCPYDFLSPQIVSNWLRDKNYKAKPEYVEWVLINSTSILKKAIEI